MGNKGSKSRVSLEKHVWSVNTYNFLFQTYLDNCPKCKEGCLKRLCSINIQHICHLGKELIHSLYITLVNLFHKCIQRLTSCTTYFCSIRQKLKVTGSLHQLQHVIASVIICGKIILVSPHL